MPPQDLAAMLSGIAQVWTVQARCFYCRLQDTCQNRELAGPGPRLARVMPNLPVLVGEGMVAYAPDVSAKPADDKLVARLLGSCGTAIQLEERHFDAVTALSGFGPAFGDCRVLCDGSYWSGAQYCRSASRSRSRGLRLLAFQDAR